MSLISFTQLQDNTTAVVAGVNTPLSTIYNDYNGNITDANIASNAAIAGDKIDLSSAFHPTYFFANTSTITFTAPFDCHMRVTLQGGFWGFGGEEFAYGISTPTGLTQTWEAQGIVSSVNSTPLQTIANALYTGGASGTSYTFTIAARTGASGGSAAVYMFVECSPTYA